MADSSHTSERAHSLTKHGISNSPLAELRWSISAVIKYRMTSDEKQQITVVRSEIDPSKGKHESSVSLEELQRKVSILEEGLAREGRIRNYLQLEKVRYRILYMR